LTNVVKLYIYIYIFAICTYFDFNISNYKVYLVNKNCSIFILSFVSHYCSFFFFFSELSCLSFFSVSHLSILQDSKYIAIYVKNIDKKKVNITRKQIQKKKGYWRKRVSNSSKGFEFPLKDASYINQRSIFHLLIGGCILTLEIYFFMLKHLIPFYTLN
jgi:hypothetical protein